MLVFISSISLWEKKRYTDFASCDVVCIEVDI